MLLENLLPVTFFVTFKDFTQGHMHVGHARIQRGTGGSPPWKIILSIGFYPFGLRSKF